MNANLYESYKPIVTFFMLGEDIYFKYNNNIGIVNNENIDNLKENLVSPYKVSFTNVSVDKMAKVLDYLKTEEDDLFWYRVKNPQTNIISYHAIFTESQKVKTL